MATQVMLQACNKRKGAFELLAKQLTMKKALSTLGLKSAWFELVKRLGGGFAVVCLGVSISGCASVPRGGLTKDSPPEVKRAVVTERINARWDALIKGDVDEAYAYLSAASKEAYPLNVYKGKVHPGMWRSVKIDSLDCEAEICNAGMTLTYDHSRMKGVQTPFGEQWIIEKGSAWFIYQP